MRPFILCRGTDSQSPPPPTVKLQTSLQILLFSNDAVPIQLNADSILVAIIAAVCPAVAPLSTAVIEFSVCICVYMYQHIPQYLMRQLLHMDGGHAAGLTAS